MGVTKAQLYDESLQRHQYDEVEAVFKITGAKAVGFYMPKPNVTQGFDAPGSATAELGQTTVDNLIGANQVTVATSFGSTAMGADVFAFVLSTGGDESQAQFRKLFQAKVEVSLAGTVTSIYVDTLDYSTTNFPNTLLTAGTAIVGKTANGNLIAVLRVTGLDAATSGYIKVTFKGQFK